MSLIAKKQIPEREPVSYKLDRSTVELVKLYSEFLGSPQEHVVNEALLFLFRKDSEFGEWLKASNKVALLSAKRSKLDSGRGNGDGGAA